MSLIYAVTDPTTGKVVEEYPTATDEQIEAALAAADQVSRGWSMSSSVTQRAALIARVADLHRERKEQLAALIVREMGKPLADAVGEVEFSADIYDFYTANADRLLADQPIDLISGEGTAVIRRSRYGVLLGIMPWNFPYYQVARFAGPNLCAGNPILLKHAPQCPTSSAAIAQIFTDAGFPAGAYVNIYATKEQTAEIIADPRVAGISLTGSERAGAAVAEIAGRHLKKVVLELGGSDPFILLSTDDLDGAVESALAARLDNTGQSCNAAKRFLVAEDLFERFLAKFTDGLLARASELSPLSSAAAAQRLRAQVEEAVAHGATFTSAGEWAGAYIPAGVLTGVTRDNPAFSQEFFGPIAMVFAVGSEEEAIELANDTPFGLGSYVFTTDPAQAARIAERIEAGMVFVNGVLLDGAELPFGGVKRSGFGREMGSLGIEEFLNKKLVRTLG